MQIANLSEHQVTLCELHEEIFSTEGIIELQLEVLNLNVSILELDEGRLVLAWRVRISMYWQNM